MRMKRRSSAACTWLLMLVLVVMETNDAAYVDSADDGNNNRQVNPRYRISNDVYRGKLFNNHESTTDHELAYALHMRRVDASCSLTTHEVATLFCVKWRHVCHLECVTSNRKSDSVNRCVFKWWTLLPNFIPIRFDTTLHNIHGDRAEVTLTSWREVRQLNYLESRDLLLVSWLWAVTNFLSIYNYSLCNKFFV